MSTPAVAFRNVSVRRGANIVWRDADLAVPSGTFTAIIGANGSGKSTLVKLVLGLIRPASGQVDVLGQPARRGNSAIGYVPQHHTLYNAAEIRCNDLVALSLTGTSWGFGKSSTAAIETALAGVGATEYASKRLSQLSGGQQRRISIAAALVTKPQLLVLDEPLAGLDLSGQVELVELIHRLNHDRQVTVLFVTHDLNPVLDHIDAAIYISAGRPRLATVEQITAPELLSTIYGTPVQVTRTPDGCVFTRAE